jgi:hypothetical protein
MSDEDRRQLRALTKPLFIAGPTGRLVRDPYHPADGKFQMFGHRLRLFHPLINKRRRKVGMSDDDFNPVSTKEDTFSR